MKRQWETRPDIRWQFDLRHLLAFISFLAVAMAATPGGHWLSVGVIFALVWGIAAGMWREADPGNSSGGKASVAGEQLGPGGDRHLSRRSTVLERLSDG